MNARRFLGALLFVLVAQSAHAATYYVSKAGSDAHSCSTTDSAGTNKVSIAAGIACLSSGDTLLVHTGTYNEVFNNPSIASGSAGAYTRIAAYPGTNSPGERDPSLAGPPAGWESVWVTPASGVGALNYIYYFQANQQYIEFDGINANGLDAEYGVFKIDSAGTGNNPHHIRYKNAEIQYGSNNPVGVGNAFLFAVLPSFQAFIGGNETINLNIHADVGGVQSGDVIGYTHYINSSDNIVAGCNLHNAGSAAVQVNNDHDSRAQRNIIRNNWIHDVVLTYFSFNAYWGIITDVDDNTQIYNNVIWNIGLNNGDQILGMNIYGSVGAKVYNNTLYGINGSSDIGIYIDPRSSSTTVQNNISYNYATPYSNSGTSTTQDHNLFGTNPLFVNASTHDFRLGTGSPAINTGATIASVTTDAVGLARPQATVYDMGAYEVGGIDIPYITPAAGTVVASASFTGSSGLALTSYTAETGGIFHQHGSLSGTMVLDTANRARLNDTNVAFDYVTAMATTSEYDVASTVRVLTLAGGDYKLYARCLTAAFTGLQVYYNIADSTFYLISFVDGGAVTTLGMYTVALTPSTSNVWTLKVRNGAIGFDLDGTQIIYTTNVPITITGVSGIGGYSPTAPSDSVGLHFDTFTITDVMASAPTTVTRARLRFK